MDAKQLIFAYKTLKITGILYNYISFQVKKLKQIQKCIRDIK